MSRFLNQLKAALDHDAARALGRKLCALPHAGKHVTANHQRLLNLASNDYLGLAAHPRLRDAAIEAVTQWGTGGTASRLVTGHLEIHQQAERAFAGFKHAEAALLLPTGYMANLAVLTTLAKPGDLICIDKLTHASLIDAARFSRAEVRAFPHKSTEKLERLMRQHREEQVDPATNIFVVTDAVFSMDGDCADLPALCALAREYDAVLVVDEAHGTGVLGETGSGLTEHQGLVGQVDITISTASKALGGLGGIVTAAQPVIDTLISKARAFIYTTAVPPSQAATLLAALEVVRAEPQLRHRLHDISADVRQALPSRFADKLPAGDVVTPIIPLIVGSAEEALALTAKLRERGILGVAIRPPTVAPGSSRVRLCLRCDLTDAEVAVVTDAIRASD